VAAKGRGVDCTLLVGSIYKELGIVRHLNYRYYHADWFVNGNSDLILAYMEKHIRNYLADGLRAVNVGQPLYRGDVLTLQIAHNQLNNHAVVYMGGGNIIHAMSHGSVAEIAFPKTWAARIGNVFRLYKG
jgi:cell wall-associated NlpC family hydrolase